VYEDFYVLSSDVLRYHAQLLLSSEIIGPIITAAAGALEELSTIESVEVILRFFYKILQFAGDNDPSAASSLATAIAGEVSASASGGGGGGAPTPLTNISGSEYVERRKAATTVLQQYGSHIMHSVLQYLVSDSHPDCVSYSWDIVFEMLKLLPSQAPQWIVFSLGSILRGQIPEQEFARLGADMASRMQLGEGKSEPSLRALLRDFVRANHR